MKILLLTPTEPGNRSFGAAQRSNDLRDALSERHDVDTLLIEGGPVLALGEQWARLPDGGRLRRLRLTQFGIGLRAWRERRIVRRLVGQLIHEGGYDVVVARYVGMANFVPPLCRDRLIVDGDDLSSTVKAGAAGALTRLKIALRLRIADTARQVWVVRASDAAHLRRAATASLPNAIRLPPPRDGSRRGPNGAPVLLMVGLFEYGPNVDGLGWFVDQVLPTLVRIYPDLSLRVVGRHAPGFLADAPSAVRVLGFVDDLAAEYDRASLVIAPITSGGGTQIKVLEALGYASPVVTTPFVREGFADSLHDGEHILVADDADSWVRCCRQVLNDPDAARTMADRGRAVVAERFGLDRFKATVARALADWR